MNTIYFTREEHCIININLLSRDCFYQLRQLRTVTRSLTAFATATLVHAFVANRLDYCSSLYPGFPACQLGCLDRVLRSAARLIGGMPKFGHVSKYLHDVLRWLPADQRISYRIVYLVLLLFTFSVVLSIVL